MADFSGSFNETFNVAIKCLFIAGLPLLGATALAGLIISGLQSAMLLREPAVNYAVKLLALLGVLYLMFPSIAKYVVLLADLSLR